MNPTAQESHQDISELLPWYVNNTLAEGERLRVKAHLDVCGACRDDLRVELQLFARLSEERGIEYMPAASLKKLQSRIEQTDLRGAGPSAAVELAVPAHRGTWTGLLAASVAALAVAVSLLAADRLTRPGGPPGNYYTVTTATERVPDAVIRAVFTPNLTLERLQGVLDAAQLRIVSGPTEAGVYSLASTSAQPVVVSLATLRHDPAVRFAETTRVVTDGSRSP
jgi:hypothetical protein